MGQGQSSNAEIAPKTAAAVLLSATPTRSDPEPKEQIQSQDTKDAKLIGHENLKGEETGILPEQLQQNYKFARVCCQCFVQRQVNMSRG